MPRASAGLLPYRYVRLPQTSCVPEGGFRYHPPPKARTRCSRYFTKTHDISPLKAKPAIQKNHTSLQTYSTTAGNPLLATVERPRIYIARWAQAVTQRTKRVLGALLISPTSCATGFQGWYPTTPSAKIRRSYRFRRARSPCGEPRETIYIGVSK